MNAPQHIIPSIQGLEALKSQLIARAKSSLLGFCAWTFPRNYKVNWHHIELSRAAERVLSGKTTRLFVFMPPRYGKTEIISRRLPAYAFGKDPNLPIIAASYAAELASANNRDVQRIIDSDEYAAVFPETRIAGERVAGKWIRKSDMFEIAGKKGVYRSAGVGGALTGSGGRLILLDDPIKNFQEALSQTKRDSIYDWYRSTLYSRLEGEGASIIIVMTRWHEDDLAGRILASEEGKNWEVFSLEALRTSKPNAVDPRKEGDPLWPWKFPLETLHEQKVALGRMFAGLYQQVPSPDEGNVWKRQGFRFHENPDDFKYDEIIQSWDLTFKDSKKSDYVVGQILGRKGASAFLLDQVRGQFSFTKTIEVFKGLSVKWPKARRKLVENKANGPAVQDALKDKIPGIILVEPEGGKLARATACEPFIDAGNFFVPNPKLNPWVTDYLEECASFPFGTNDDQVDTTSQGLLYLLGRSNQRLIKLLQM